MVERSSQNDSLLANFGIPEFGPGCGSFGKGSGVVEQGIGAPGEGHSVDLAVLLDQRPLGEGWRKLGVVGDLGQIERSDQAGAAEHGGHVARRRDHVVVGSSAPA